MPRVPSGEEELIEPLRGQARVSVMTATVRITGDGASVDGCPVEVPAGLDPVRCCLDRVCRDDGPVRALIVDERDGWEYRVVVHQDGLVEEDLDPPPAVRVAARRWRVGPVAAVVVVLSVASWHLAKEPGYVISTVSERPPMGRRPRR
jgi:hypothetical protein